MTDTQASTGAGALVDTVKAAGRDVLVGKQVLVTIRAVLRDEQGNVKETRESSHIEEVKR